MSAEIAVIAEAAEGKPAPVVPELIAFARALRRDSTSPVRVFIPGRGIGPAAVELARLPGVAVVGVEGEVLALYSAEAWKKILAPLLAALKPRFILVAHTANGADFAPGLAVRLGAACITAVEAFRMGAEGPVFSRSIHKGKLRTEVVPEAATSVITLLPGVFRRGDPPALPEDKTRKYGGNESQNSKDEPSIVEMISAPDLSLKTRPLGLLPAPDEAADLTAAEVVVAAGRGIGSDENLAILSRLAACFSRSALGASRSVCDAGWLPRRCQIGQTGKTIAPRLYIACGISGALQHLAGMRGSQCIVAINKDPQAAIFRAADVGIVEELVSFLPLLVAACRKWRNIQGEGRA